MGIGLEYFNNTSIVNLGYKLGFRNSSLGGTNLIMKRNMSRENKLSIKKKDKIKTYVRCYCFNRVGKRP